MNVALPMHVGVAIAVRSAWMRCRLRDDRGARQAPAVNVRSVPTSLRHFARGQNTPADFIDWSDITRLAREVRVNVLVHHTAVPRGLQDVGCCRKLLAHVCAGRRPYETPLH